MLPMSFWRLYLILPGALSQTGEIGFLPRQVDALEGCQFLYNFRCCNYDYVGLARSGGSNGTITARLTILPGTTATEGVDFDFYQDSVTWQDGDVDPKAMLIVMYDNDVYELTKVVQLGIDADPAIASSTSETTAYIRDDNDGGTVEISPTAIVLDERFGNTECLMWAERSGPVASGKTELMIEYTTCPEMVPERNRAGDNDYWGLPLTGPQVWEDGETGKRCVLRNLGFQAAVDMVWPACCIGANSSNNTLLFLVNPDAEEEAEERVCFQAWLSGNSTATLPATSMLQNIIINDVNLMEELKLNCTRGLDCLLDVSKTSIVGGEAGLILDAEESDYKCPQTCNFTANSSLQLSYTSTGNAEETFINLGKALRDWKPGEKMICKCGGIAGGDVTHVATMELHGPYLGNTASCVKSWATCDIPDLLGIGYKVGADHLRVLKSCDDAKTTPFGLAMGSHAVYGADGVYRMENFEAMRPTIVGMYRMCWCRETADRNCTVNGDFSVSAGSFVYRGPNIRAVMDPYELGGGWGTFKVSEFYGTGLEAGDRAMVLQECGEEVEGLNVTTTYNEADKELDFGVLSAGNGLLARAYKVCWCQLAPARGHYCNSATEFRAEIGSVTFLCPRREVDRNRDGICELCPMMFQTAGGWDGMQCVIDGGLFSLSILWYLVGLLLFLACTTSLRCGRTTGFVHGVPRLIEDVSRESDTVLVTVVGYHNLTVFNKMQSIPVTLSGTGHFLLDSRVSKNIPFRVRPRSSNTLELLDAEGNSLDFRADSSMGLLRISLPRALLHSTIMGVRFPLLAQILFLSAGWVALGLFLMPGPVEMVIVILIPLLLAGILTCVWCFVLRTSSSLARRLEMFSKELKKRNPHPKACKKGPDRAIAVRDVLELYEKFAAFIKDRNMYYIDPNILRQLTSTRKLSYAELVGPQQVQWFVSHWWGTRFQVYCLALQRHAKAVCETLDPAVWGATSYWICTFSNNQYQIKEELGTSHKESSFYLALHSGICRGTCMILDEMAMPLKRSWCLFELLQTITLEQSQVGFKGLLFCTENGVLNFGASTVEMSMQIGERLSTLSLEDAEATTEQDKNMITQLVLQEMESFEKINTVLREHIGHALGRCRDRVDDDFDTLFVKLGTLDDDQLHLARAARNSQTDHGTGMAGLRI